MGTFRGSTSICLICLRKRHWKHTKDQEIHDTVSKTKAIIRTNRKNGTSNIPKLETWEVSETSVRHNNKETMRSGTGTCKLPSNEMFRSSFETLESVVVVELSPVEAWEVSEAPARHNNKNTTSEAEQCQAQKSSMSSVWVTASIRKWREMEKFFFWNFQNFG